MIKKKNCPSYKSPLPSLLLYVIDLYMFIILYGGIKGGTNRGTNEGITGGIFTNKNLLVISGFFYITINIHSLKRNNNEVTKNIVH